MPLEVGKKEVIGAWRKGAMPLMFQEKMRRVLGLGGGGGSDGGKAVVVDGFGEVLRRFEGGGLMKRLMGCRVRYCWTLGRTQLLC